MDIKTKLNLHRVTGIHNKSDHFVLVTTEGDCIAELHTGGDRWAGHDQTERNARRLKACWNTCAGIPTEILETVDPDHQPALYVVQAKRIVELEAACIKINTFFVYFESNLPPDKQIGKGAREALAEIHRVIGGQVLSVEVKNADAH